MLIEIKLFTQLATLTPADNCTKVELVCDVLIILSGNSFLTRPTNTFITSSIETDVDVRLNAEAPLMECGAKVFTQIPALSITDFTHLPTVSTDTGPCGLT